MSIEDRLSQSAEIAEKFVELYYDSMDKARQKLLMMYLDDATLSWNGNGGKGKAYVMNLILAIPPTQHEVASFDAVPMIVDPLPGRPSIMILVAGSVRFDKGKEKAFQQSFVLVIEEGKGRIYSDVFRLQDE
ncbi:NTF2-related export protein-like isoform X1 [Artemia franciscana]|uniref:NTF2-related export protein-like isoform X1 n=1 Tax=Artemia franciscana TaxID=6661 RepID=UPI0032DB4A44